MPIATKSNQLSVINNHSQTGTLLKLSRHQIKAFIDGSICPFCKEPNLIYRTWRDDHYCGMCREVFELKNGRVYHLGHQDQID